MAITKKHTPSILGGSSLKDKLSIARKELDALHNDDSSELIEHEQQMAIKNEIEVLPKFHLTGRCNRKDQKYITKAFYILDSLDKEIKQYCSGGDVALFNYLIHLGLTEIKKRENHSFDEISAVEHRYII